MNFKRVFDSFNEFSDFDKDTFEALAINAIKNRGYRTKSVAINADGTS